MNANPRTSAMKLQLNKKSVKTLTDGEASKAAGQGRAGCVIQWTSAWCGR
jgi:hypothetical protein